MRVLGLFDDIFIYTEREKENVKGRSVMMCCARHLNMQCTNWDGPFADFRSKTVRPLGTTSFLEFIYTIFSLLFPHGSKINYLIIK